MTDRRIRQDRGRAGAHVGLAIVGMMVLGACGRPPEEKAVVAAPATPAALPMAKPEALQEFRAGMRQVRLGAAHYDEAGAHLVRATTLDPALYEAWHNLGVVLLAQGREDEAIEAFGKALRVAPGSRKTLLGLVEASSRAQKWGDARQVLEQHLSAHPEDVELRLRYAQVLRESGKKDAALEQVRTVLRKDGRNLAAYQALGVLFLKMGKLDLAEVALRKAAELGPERASIWNNLGLVALGRGRVEEAFTLFEKASRLDPKDVEARLNKVVVYLDCGDYKRAYGEARLVVDVDPANVDALVAMGVAARGQGKHAEAARAYERALELEPRHPAALYNLGILYMEFERNPARAKEYLTRFAEATPSRDPKRADALARIKELK